MIPSEPKLSILRKYFYESVLVSLSVCVVSLFYMYNDIQKYIRETLTEQNVQMKVTIQENTKVLNETKSLIIKNSKDANNN